MPNARKTDPKTSHEAAEKVANVHIVRQYVLKALNRPRTDEDLREAYNALKGAPTASESGIRSRRAELVRQGLVKSTGRTEKTRYGRSAIVWERVEA